MSPWGAGAGLRIGLDIGGTKTEAVALEDGVVAARVRLATMPGHDGVVATVRQAVEELQQRTGSPDFASIGVGVPGQIDADGATVRHAVNVQLTDLDLRTPVEGLFAVPVRVENDVKVAALGAHLLRGGGDESLGYLNLGTGIAAGTVLQGRLWRGVGGVAGEIGHLSIDPHGPQCVCGQRGCVEAFAGGRALARRWAVEGASAWDIFDAAEAGDRHARQLRHELGWAVAAAVRLMVLSLDVPAVVLGGGISALGGRLLDQVIGELRRESGASAFLRSLDLGDRVELLPPGSPAAALGAALLGSSGSPSREHRLAADGHHRDICRLKGPQPL